MTGVTHASIGAAIGSLIKKPSLAFIAGFLSHIPADMTPHRDLSPKVEAGLLAGVMTLIAVRYGIKSPEFWGALGAVSPDFEHALAEAGLIDLKDENFPTHVHFGKWHGRQSDERISQLLIFVCSLLLAERVQSITSTTGGGCG